MSDPDPDDAAELPLSTSTRRMASVFVCALPRGLPLPDQSTDRDGDAYLEWDFGPRRVFSVAVGGRGVIHFAGISGEDTVHGTAKLGETIPRILIEWVRRVAGAEVVG